MKRPLALLAILFTACIVLTRSVGAAEPSAIASFDRMFASVHAYTYQLRSHEVLGNQTQNRVYRYSFMKPHFAKTLIISGDGNGSGGVWAGGDQVSGHQGGFLSGIHLKVGLHDGRATSVRGYTIPDGLIQNIVARLTQLSGKLTQVYAGKFNGQPVDRVQLIVANPSADHGITMRQLYFSRTTHWPVRGILYVGGTVVQDQSFTNINPHANLSQNDFPF